MHTWIIEPDASFGGARGMMIVRAVLPEQALQLALRDHIGDPDTPFSIEHEPDLKPKQQHSGDYWRMWKLPPEGEMKPHAVQPWADETCWTVTPVNQSQGYEETDSIEESFG